MHGNIKFPIPENFVEEFNSIPNCTIRYFENKYGVNTITVKRWAKEAGVFFNKSNRTLEEIYGVDQVQDWINQCTDPTTANNLIKKLGFSKDKLKGAAKRLGLPYKHFMGKTVIPAPNKEELQDLIDQGKTNQEIQKIFKVNNPVLKRWYKELGIERVPYEGRLTSPITKEELLELHINQEMTINEIAHKYKTSPVKIANWLKMYNIDQQQYRRKRKVFLTKEELFDLHINKKISFAEIARQNNISDVSVGNLAKEYNIENVDYGIGQTSNEEIEVLEFIQTFFPSASKIELKDLLKINKRKKTVSYDICIPELKLLIEYNGNKWHSEKYTDPNKHIEKMNLAHYHGYKIINIFSDEWKEKQDIVKSILKAKMGVIKNTIFARKTKFVSVSTKEANQFYQENHIQGRSNHYSFSYGLIYKNELVACMSFGIHHRNQNSPIILKRYASKLNIRVVGGASKIFSRVVKIHELNHVKTWSDNRWSDGNLYKLLGFKKTRDLPKSYSYVYNDGTRKSAQSHTKKLIGCPPEISERDFLYMQGIFRIWDCGKQSWEWKAEK